jgi:hypothetical protein
MAKNYDLARPENLRLLAVLLIVYALGTAASEMQWPHFTSFGLVLGLARIFIIYIIARNGTTLNARPFAQLISLLISIGIIGALFKILHWEGANTILLAAFFGIPALYTVRFILRPTHRLTDFLKWLWVLAEGAAIAFRTLHWKYGDEIAGAEEVILWAMIFSVYYDLMLSRKAENGQQNQI